MTTLTATDAQVDRRATNVAYLESRYGAALVGVDLPDAVMFDSTAEGIDALVELADERDETPRRAWRWLREDLTEAEAVAWLEA